MGKSFFFWKYASHQQCRTGIFLEIFWHMEVSNFQEPHTTSHFQLDISNDSQNDFFYNLIKNLICFLGMNGWIVLYCLTTVYTIMSQNYPHKLTREMFMSDYRERESFSSRFNASVRKMWWQWKKVFVGLVRCWEEVRDDDKNKMKKWVTKSHVLEFHLPSSLAML